MSDREGEYRIFGPPGTGKTTTLTRNIKNAAEKHGGASVLCASFTKAAAQVLVGRIEADGITVPTDNVGTVHSLCYRGVGSPELAEAHVADFNETVPPQYQLSKAVAANVKGKMEDQGPGQEDDTTESASADEIFHEYNLLRNRLVPDERMPVRVQAWAQWWERWKAENEYMDFTDLLEAGVKKLHYPPNGASILFVDEAQDLTPLQFKLVRAWGRSVRYYIVSGDDDQLLFAWSGASNEALLERNIPEDHIRVLAQSYRIPAQVHRLANSWIKRVSARQPKEYRPRDYEGVVRVSPATFKDVSSLRRTLEECATSGRSIMLLTAAKYQLRPVIKQLRAWGIPYHNPCRRSAGDWNPMRNSQIERLKAFLHPAGPEFGGFKLWTPEQLKSWVDVCGVSGLLQRGGKAAIDKFAQSENWDTEQLLDLYTTAFVPSALDMAVSRNPGWLVENIKPERRSGHEYLLGLRRIHGESVWDKSPACVVGTIHSVKGDEADVVALFPDLTPSACAAATSPAERIRTEAKDAIIRQYYVGMTRAREELVICSSATSFNVEVVK